MTETLHARWKPGTLDTLFVTSPHSTLEWPVSTFERVFGRDAIAQLYLQGRVMVTREALPLPPLVAVSRVA